MEYSLDELKKIYEKATFKAVEQLENDFIEANKNKEEFSERSVLPFTMQNILAMAILRKFLFEELAPNEK